MLHSPLPFYDQRPPNIIVDTIVIHSLYSLTTQDPYNVDSCIASLVANQVSAHYLIAQDGKVTELVDPKFRAWHAGESKMPFMDDSRENVNNFSIGIELIGRETEGFTEPEYLQLADLTKELLARFPIVYVVGHQHISPTRKSDPGDNFDWRRYNDLLGGAPLRFAYVEI